ncbi:LOB DOMAIN-CONTAINING PROTEIN 22 [Salix koriyanagi]|uniref:LOB DOMAIN-CONTAINING PROTEIN 22 n=1 Tax=Salix koriyanagi TaxID=2511006 RepID=A0A9Q0VCK0_9ROSI|nr:LOB DOMAIN-CONTAINING PROTEIN 22 [Salix koriyanagi]
MRRPSCAACKNQRRKCDDHCFIAPYFPAEKSRDFEAVHKHFGLHNVISILRSLPLQQRSDAVISLVYEANARVRDPVGGCTRIISALRQRINTLKAQLNFVKNQNAYYRTMKQQQLRQQNMVHNAGFVDFLRENNFPSSNQDFNLLHENLENHQQLQNPSSAQNQIAYHHTLKQQQLGRQNMFHNAGSVNFLQEHNNANLLPSPSQDFTFLNDNLENPQQLQESSSAQNQISHYRALKLQQLGQQNMVHQSGFVDFFQEHNNANLPQSPNQDFTFLNENLESPQQLQESSFAQESQLFGGDPLANSQGPSQQHQETGFGQGSYQSHGDSMTSLSIGSSKNVFGGDQRTSPSTIGQPVQRPLQKLQEIGFVQGSYQSHGDSATNLSIGASNNVFGGGQQTSLSNIGWPFQRLLHKHQGSFRFHGDSATNLSSEASRNVFGGSQLTSLSTIGRPVQRPLQQHQETGLVQGSDQSQGDSVTNISIESSKNVLGGDENVEPERIKSSSPSSKVHGRKRPLEDSEAYLDLDLDSVQQHQETGLVQGSDQSQGDSVTNISIEASENVLGGGENVEPESIKSSSPSSKVHGRKRPLEDSEDYLDLELDSVTNTSIEASENVLGGGENVEPESIKSSSPSSKVHGRKRPLEDSEDYLDLDLDSVTDISIEASENVLDGGEYVEPERIKSPSPSSKVHGRKRPLEDCEDYLDLDLDLDDDDNLFRDST